MYIGIDMPEKYISVLNKLIWTCFETELVVYFPSMPVVDVQFQVERKMGRFLSIVIHNKLYQNNLLNFPCTVFKIGISNLKYTHIQCIIFLYHFLISVIFIISHMYSNIQIQKV